MAAIVMVVVVVLAALIFDFTNGFHDTANAMATFVATGALRRKVAVAIAGSLNLVGAFLSVEVAKPSHDAMPADVAQARRPTHGRALTRTDQRHVAHGRADQQHGGPCHPDVLPEGYLAATRGQSWRGLEGAHGRPRGRAMPGRDGTQ